jgi:hypothetical protein
MNIRNIMCSAIAVGIAFGLIYGFGSALFLIWKTLTSNL